MINITVKVKKTPVEQVDYHKQYQGKYIAVDYDDTITLPRPYPEKAPLNPQAKKYLTLLHEAGYKLVLWTARCGDAYEEAWDRCINEFGLPLIRDSKELIHGDSGKLVASFYIDDKSCLDSTINWKKIYNYIIKNIR